MTTIKFGVIGICYIIVIAIGVGVAAIVSLATA